MEKLTWFKFNILDYMSGEIQMCSDATQARFIKLICRYWAKDCILSVEKAQKLIGEEAYDELVDYDILKEVDDSIQISFLDEQYGDVQKISEKRRQAAEVRWKRNAKAEQDTANEEQMECKTMQTDADKIREEEIREDKKRESNTPPTPGFVSGNNLKPFLLKQQDLIQSIEQKTRLPPEEVIQLVEDFAEREKFNGMKTEGNWRDYCYKSVIKSFQEKGTKEDWKEKEMRKYG